MGSPFKQSKEERKDEQENAGVAAFGAAAFAALKEAGEADAVAEAAGQPVRVSIDVPPARKTETAVETKSEHVTIRMTPAFKKSCVAAAARRGLRLSTLVEKLMQAVIEQDRAAGLID